MEAKVVFLEADGAVFIGDPPFVAGADGRGVN